MVQFVHSGITNNGKDLLAKVQVNQTAINFTKMAAGSGEMPPEGTVRDTTELYNKVMDLEITKLQINPDTTVTVGSILNNTGLESGFEFRELGLYAEDPDLGEILYSYGNAADAHDFIPPASSGIVEQLLDIITSVGDAEVTAVIESGLYATHEDLANLHTEINADISNLETNKLDKTGDASNVTNTFTQASTRANLVSGENQTTTFGKLMKWFADLKPVAWSGNAADLTEDASNRLVTDSEKDIWNGKITSINGELAENGNIQLNSEDVGAISKNIDIPTGSNLNDYQVEGFYSSRQNSNIIENAPIANTAFSLLVEKTTSDGWKQTWSNYRTEIPAEIYVRTSYNEVWGEWEQIATETSLKKNRTLINDEDIGYDDTIHATTPLQDILKDLFDKSQALVGSNKPFELTFLTAPNDYYNPNLNQKIHDFIMNNYGISAESLPWVKFKLEASTANGSTSEAHISSNKCSVWNEDFYFEWEFDYDRWEDVIVRDAAGNFTNQQLYDVLGMPGGTNSTDITLSDSVYNFDSISIGVTMGDAAIDRTHEKIPITHLTSIHMSSLPYSIDADEIYYSNLNFSNDSTGTILSPSGQSTVYVAYSRISNGITPSIYTDGCGILTIWGHNRIYPSGTTHAIRQIGDKMHKVITLPNGEEKITLLPNSDFNNNIRK